MEGTASLYKLAVELGKTFNLLIAYMAAGISFHQVPTGMSVSASSGVGRWLLSVNEELVRRYVQAVIGIKLLCLRA